MAIKYTKEDRIAIFTIDRPEAVNAMNVKMFEELHAALIDFRDDDNLLVGIITGQGDKAFCSGVDVKDFLPFINKTANKPWLVPATTIRRLDIFKPIIAAINGVAFGGGFELALSCDIRIASENAKFAMPEVTLGVFPGGGGTQRLSRLIPRGLAAEMLFTGKSIDAHEALRVGLVNKVTRLTELMPAAQTIANSICQAGPLAVQAVKQAMLRGDNVTLEEGLRMEEDFTRRIVSTIDFAEGIRAFIEKRKPNFTGH